MQSCTTCFYKSAVLQQFSTLQAMCFANGRQLWQGQRPLFTESCCCGDACEETVMHVKSHDQVLNFNALEPFSYSLFFSVELHLILRSLYDNSHKLRLSMCNHCILPSTHTHISDGHDN